MKKYIIILCLLNFQFQKISAQKNKHDSITISYLDKVSYYLDSLGVKEKDYVLSQAMWETGWFQCKNCAWSKGYNLFGFRSGNGYIKYKSYKESAIAYSKWQNKRYAPYKLKYPNKSYLDFLVYCKYAEDANYLKKVIYMHNWLIKNYYKNK